MFQKDLRMQFYPRDGTSRASLVAMAFRKRGVSKPRPDFGKMRRRMPFQHNGIVMTDLEGRIKYANIFMCDLLGLEHNELHERSGLEFAFPEDLDVARTLFAATRPRSTKPFRFRLRRNDGAAV